MPRDTKFRCEKCGRADFGGPGQLGTHRRTCGIPMETFFWPKVNKDAANGCWEWTASRKEKGYGQFLYKRKMHRAHRLAWIMLNGDPGALEVAHKCDNRICVNPAHLFLATHQENMADCKSKGRQARATRAKLTVAQVRAIRSEYRAKNKRRTNSQALAAKYGIGVGAISAIMRGETWSHIK
jgi:hypothetical protein